jgi:hypothetical protein
MVFIKKYKWWLLVLTVMMVGALSAFSFYRHDVTALEEFSASYQRFDKASLVFSASVSASNLEGVSATDGLELKTDEALVELNTKASVRISSLIRNDGELMSAELEIADLSRKELSSLKAYKKAIQSKSTDADRLAREHDDLTNKRRAAYAHFQRLGSN